MMLEYLVSAEFWVGLIKIIGVNIILSGDNAVVIALAARSLPPKQQTQAIIWGSGAAIVMRIILTLFAVALLTLPWLQLAGGVGVAIVVALGKWLAKRHEAASATQRPAEISK